LLGNGDGTFQNPVSYSVGFNPEAIAVADLGNGHPDLIVASSGGWGESNLSVFLGDGTGSFQKPINYAVAMDPWVLAVKDLGNGHPDIITANYDDKSISVLLGNGDGTFQAATQYPVGDNLVSMVVRDLGNGHLDVVTGNYDQNVSVL